MTETSEDFSVHRFVQDLFEDLSLTLPSLGCRFQGLVTPSALTVHGQQGHLKNKLFLLFAELASQSSQLETRFRLASRGQDLQMGFVCQPFFPEICTAFPIWDASLFSVMELEEGTGFYLCLPPGTPLEAGPPVHWRELGQMYGGQANGRQVLDHFIVRCEALLVELKCAIEAQDGPAILRLSHTIKGSGRGVTAKALAEAALQLEMFSRSGDMTRIHDLYKALLDTYDEFIRWVQEGQQ